MTGGGWTAAEKSLTEVLLGALRAESATVSKTTVLHACGALLPDTTGDSDTVRTSFCSEVCLQYADAIMALLVGHGMDPITLDVQNQLAAWERDLDSAETASRALRASHYYSTRSGGCWWWWWLVVVVVGGWCLVVIVGVGGVWWWVVGGGGSDGGGDG